MVEMILNVLSKPDINEDGKKSRDDLLEKLEMHIDDVSAHVRTKVIQHWARLQKEGVVPVKLQLTILKKVVAHLFDKSALVRKSSSACITSFLSYNPFGANVSSETFLLL